MNAAQHCSLLLASLLLPFIAEVSNAQDRSPLRLGVTFGVSGDVHQTDGIRFAENEPRTPLLGSTTGHTGRMGLVAEYRLNERWGVSAHLDYASGSARFTHASETPAPYEVEFVAGGSFRGSVSQPDPNDPRAKASYEYHARLRYQHIDFDLVASRILLGDNSTFSFGVAAGPAISMTIDADLRSGFMIRQDMSDGIYAEFTDRRSNTVNDLTGSRTTLALSSVRDSEEWRIGLRGGFFAGIGSINDNGVVAAPGIYFDYGITPPVSGEKTWNSFSVTGRVDVTVNL